MGSWAIGLEVQPGGRRRLFANAAVLKTLMAYEFKNASVGNFCKTLCWACVVLSVGQYANFNFFNKSPMLRSLFGLTPSLNFKLNGSCINC